LKENPDSLLVIAASKNAADISRFVRIKNPSIRLFSSSYSYNHVLLEEGGKYVDQTVFPIAYQEFSTRPLFKEFSDHYQNDYHTIPGFPEMYYYESILILHKALTLSGRLDSESLRKAIITTGSFEGLQNTLIIDRFGDAKREIYLSVIENNQFKTLNKGDIR
jgi:branched-chain amino acid transport system substrate-binding protein